MKNIFCILGFHKYKKTTNVKYIDGSITEHFKCIKCNRKKQWSYNPTIRPRCPNCEIYYVNGLCNCNTC